MIFRKRGTPDVICLPDGPVALWQKRRSAKARAKMATVAVGGSMALAGCTTLGTNISGDFSCRAPNGTCAPSTVIDDRALALIAGGVSTQPAGAYPMAPTHSAPRMASAGPRPPGATVARTDQKVLTVVFPAHVDAKGRLFEATTVRTVVDTGSWAVASGSSPVRMVGTSTDRSTLLPHPDALGATEPAADSLVTSDMMPPALAADPDLPSAEAVAAARERGQARSDRTVTTSAETDVPVNAPQGFVVSVED